MIYRAIGVMSGSSLDGLDIAFIEFTETGGKWGYEILAAECLLYDDGWQKKLSAAAQLSALGYLLLHAEYGHYTGNKINSFINTNNLHHRVNLIASHGHTVFHFPQKKMTAQLGDGAAVAAETRLPVISDLRSIDVAFGGQGAPVVPIGEKLLFNQYGFLLNIGGIANISVNINESFVAFDVCAANRILNLLVAKKGLRYDDEGKLAASGNVNDPLLQQLNQLEYYNQPAPKSLDNSFGTNIVLPMIEAANLSKQDALNTYVEHIAQQIKLVVAAYKSSAKNNKILVTGGGAFNTFLIERLTILLQVEEVIIVVPESKLVKYKEAMIMALMGVLRWREETNVLSAVTGAAQNTISGALWLGTQA